MILIGESGSTKTDWVLIDKDNHKQFFKTQGLNPYFVKPEEFTACIQENIHTPGLQVDYIYFYGAGCGTDAKRTEVENNIKRVFPHAKIEVTHDMMAAARALCGHGKGTACILGTGSHACIYNGTEIVDEAVSLGFILGDEGSGAHMGKQLITAFLYNELPDDLLEKFIKDFPTDKATVLENIYRKPYPSRYLAGFVPFLVQYKEHQYIANLVNESFDLFITRHVKTLYNYADFPCHFVGSVAFMFEPELKKKLQQHGLKMGEIMNKPIDGLIRYHAPASA